MAFRLDPRRQYPRHHHTRHFRIKPANARTPRRRMLLIAASDWPWKAWRSLSMTTATARSILRTGLPPSRAVFIPCVIPLS